MGAFIYDLGSIPCPRFISTLGSRRTGLRLLRQIYGQVL